MTEEQILQIIYFIAIMEATEFVLRMNGLHLCPIHGLERVR